MQIEHVLPHVLEWIDTARLGPRKVAMLELVYRQQRGEKNFVPLGDRELARLTHRSPAQVSYDRRALDGLVGLGMLRKVEGRGRIANGYQLREPSLWGKRIRWLATREHVISFFSDLLPRDAILLPRDGAGQSIIFPRGGGSKLPSLPRDPSVGHRAATEFDRATSSAIRTVTEGTDRAATEPPAAPSLLRSESEFTPSLPPSEGVTVSERELEHQGNGQDPGGLLLAAVVANHAGDWIGGVYADRIRGVGRSRPDLLPQLLAFAGKLTWVKTAIEATRQMELQLALLAQRPEDRRAREQTHIDACDRCDHKGLIFLDDDTVMRCDHEPHDDMDGVGFGLDSKHQTVAASA